MSDSPPTDPVKRAPVFVVVIFLLAVLAAGAWIMLTPPPSIVQGEFEATQVNLGIKVTGRLVDQKVKKGETVKKGDLLLVLENPDLNAKLAQAIAAAQVAEAEKQKIFTGSREEDITQELNAWNRSKAIAEQAQRNFVRIKQLREKGSAPIQQLEEAMERLQTSLNSERAAAAKYQKAVTGNRPEEKEVAVARVTQAQAVVQELQENLKELTVIAPISGEVAQINIDPGELASPGAPLISIVDLDDVWATVNLREDRLSRIKMGEVVRGKVPALGDKEVDLKIHFIAPLGDFATWRATKATGDFDLKTFEIRASPAQPVEGLRPGMSVLFDVPRP